MRVLFASGYNPFSVGSGPGNGLYHLSQSLAAIGCEVHMLVPQTSTNGELTGVEIHYYGDPLKKTRFGKSWIPLSVFSMKQISALCKEYKIDIVNGRSPTTFAYSMFRSKKQPFVVSAHGTSFGELISHYTSPLNISTLPSLINQTIIQSTWASLTNLEYKNADRVVAVSDAVAKELVNYYGLNKRKIVVIPNGINALSVEEPEREDENLILSVGRMIWRKGFLYLIEAMPDVLREFPQAKLLLVGEGPYKQELIDLSKRLSLEKSVFFSDNLPRDKLYHLYANAHIYVQPSLYEPLGNTILEAMISGKPVIASNVGGIPEIIVDKKSGLLVEPYSSEQLSERIKYLLSDYDYCKRLGRNAQYRVNHSFSWSLVAKKTLQLYRTLLN